MGYTKNTISGFSWQTLLKIAVTLITLGKIMVIARILNPQDFGLFALIAIALGLAEATTQTGINLTILQSKKTIGYFINTAWVIAITRGLIIGIIMVVMGVGMTRYYNEPRLSILISIAAFIPIIKGFINPSVILFQKNLEFLKDSVFKLSLVIIEAFFAIILSIFFRDVIALILAMITSAFFEVLISFWIFKDKPKFQYISSRSKEIFSNAKGLTVSAALSYLNENIDDFLLGKTIGTHNLGLYHNAYSLGHKANYDFAKSINHSTLPIFSKITEDIKRLKSAFLKSMTATILIVFSVSLPLLIAPNLIVNFVLGQKWLSIVPSLYLFVFAGILQSITIIFYTLFYAKKRYTALNFHLFLTVLILIILIKYLSPISGITGAGQALVISRLITLPIIFYETFKIFNK
ncbi:MAG: oligosaccharide flippase family protein [Pseudomonadales bacterium]|nr:oligosaccharide flippase family protein [Pseudomonadales bacterium]